MLICHLEKCTSSHSNRFTIHQTGPEHFRPVLASSYVLSLNEKKKQKKNVLTYTFKHSEKTIRDLSFCLSSRVVIL